MKELKSGVSLDSSKRNRYLFDKRLKRLLLIHPVLQHIFLHLDNGGNINEWPGESKNDHVELDGLGHVSKDKILYYYRKYLLLKKNGHFTPINQKKVLSSRLTPQLVESSLANSMQVTFEVTEKCNLKCEYCGYGKFYNDYSPRKDRNLSLETAAIFLNYLAELWNSSLNQSHGKNIFIGFYGGEPLLNFSFMRELIRLSQEIHLVHNRFSYSVTTNGLLLDKYMDFLAEHQFHLLISLDGNESNNQFRVLKNGKHSFKEIIRNIELLQTRYPDYFEKYVNFNAVLHNKNSVSEIFNYFKKQFDKVPNISPLNTSGIHEKHKDLFWKTYSNVTESLYNSEDYSRIEDEMFVKLPTLRDLSLFLFSSCDFSFRNYNQVLQSNNNKRRLPTGTCIPFSRKVFVTADGQILPCERIGQNFLLGRINNKKIQIDYNAIAQKYNTLFDKMNKQCSACYNAEQCIQCIFNLDWSDSEPRCNGFMDRNVYSRHLKSYIDFLEEKPQMYHRIFKDVSIG